MFKSRVFTLYPDYFPGYLEKGLFGKAMKEKIWSLEIVDIRNYAEDKHKTVAVSYTHLTLPTNREV